MTYSNLKSLFCLLVFIANTYCLVQHFTANQVKLSPRASIAKKHRLDSSLKQHSPHAFANKLKMERLNKQGPSSVDLNEFEYAWIGDISVGTPPQNFTVEFDPFYAVDLELIDSKTDITGCAKVPTKNLYDPSNQYGNGTAQLTFGAEKSIYCEDNSGYVPLLHIDDSQSYTYQFYASSANALLIMLTFLSK
uniref:Peptidase A1 domain-containing protein n=1 Tax=Ditylenchus dipsaci TaxID=166011 RepID=A0A915DPJ3_9BILA